MKINTCKKINHHAPNMRIRRGKKMRSGMPTSITSVAAVAKCWKPGGSLSAYQATTVGSGWVCQWKLSADRLRQVGSPLSSLTAPDRK